MTSLDRAHSDLSITVAPGLPRPPLLHLRGTQYGLWVHGLPWMMDVEAAVTEAVAETGRVDVLVNNAGILRDNVAFLASEEAGCLSGVVLLVDGGISM
jgi:hypothetical protein